MKRVSLDQIRLETWLELVGTDFQVPAAPATTERLRLLRVDGSPAPAGAAIAAECFSLIFHGLGDRPLPQRTYWFEHPQLGGFEMFIVPNGGQAGAWEYEALFNRPALK